MNITLIIVIFYMVLMLFVSWWSTRLLEKQDTKNYLLAGQNLNWQLVGVTIAGLGIGGVATVGVAENAYTMGLAPGWYDLSWAIGAVFVGLFITDRLRRSTTMTVNEIILKAHGKVAGNVVVVINTCVTFAIYAMQMVAGGAILASLLPDIFTIENGMLVSAVIFCIIAIIGGLWAASLSNLINVIFIIVGLVVGLAVAISHFGGLGEIATKLPVSDKWFSFTKGYGGVIIFAQVLSLTVLATSNPVVTQTILASKSGKDAKYGLIFAGILMAPMGFVAAMFGIVAASQFPGLASAKLALPAIVTQLNPWIAGLTLSGLWAADVSTATCIAVSQSTMIAKDVLVRYCNPGMSERSQILASRVVMLICTVLGYFWAVNMRGIIDTLMMMLTLWTPIAVLLVATFVLPQITRKSTGMAVIVVGGTVGIASLFMPEIVILKQPVFGTLIASLAAWMITAVVDKRHFNEAALYSAPETADVTLAPRTEKYPGEATDSTRG